MRWDGPLGPVPIIAATDRGGAPCPVIVDKSLHPGMLALCAPQSCPGVTTHGVLPGSPLVPLAAPPGPLSVPCRFSHRPVVLCGPVCCGLLWLLWGGETFKGTHASPGHQPTPPPGWPTRDPKSPAAPVLVRVPGWMLHPPVATEPARDPLRGVTTSRGRCVSPSDFPSKKLP